MNQIVAGQGLDIAMLKDVAAKVATAESGRRVITHLCVVFPVSWRARG